MKENRQPILSICIPTWNRWYALQYTLKSIIEQEEFKSGDVEIVISDNVSTDETEVEIGKLCKKYNNIRYFRNNKNIGGNPNINKVLSLGKGEYLWLLGSDSLICEGGLKKTLEIIQQKSPDIIYNNVVSLDKYNHLEDYYDRDLGVYFFDNLKNYFLFLGKQYNHDKRSFLYLQNLLTFISSICISKNFYAETLNEIMLNYGEKYFNNYSFSQELVCYSRDVKGLCVINECFIDRFKGKRNTYFVGKKVISDFKELSNFIETKYKINNKDLKRLFSKSLRFWYKLYVIGKITKLLIKYKLYRSFAYCYRKLKNIKSSEYIENISS